MKNRILFLALLIILSINSYSQIAFENGYFINESNLKTECLIKNIEWKSNPTEFEYRLSPTEAIQVANIDTVKEFGINGYSKYIRALVKIDRSGDMLSNLSYERNPNFQEEQLFLKVLIEGKASLFLYTDGSLTRFFYKLNDSDISQLVYKRYYLDENNIQNSNRRMAYNNYFKQQLLLDLKCPGISFDDANNTDYNNRDLKRFFVKYNECSNSTYTNYDPEQKKDLINLSLRPGLNYSNSIIQGLLSDELNTDFGNKATFRLGIEAEFILPYNRSKWSVIFEPGYHSYKAEERRESSTVVGDTLVSDINYQSIDFLLGLRYYFFLNDVSKIFINLSYIYDYSYNSDIKFKRIDGSIFNEFGIEHRGGNLALGFGYKYKDRYSLEMQYQTNREFLSNSSWESEYKTLSIVFGYSLF